MNKEQIEEMGFIPTTLCENPDECACEWKKQLVAKIERLKAENDKLDKESTAYGLIIQKQDKEKEDLLRRNIELQKRNDQLKQDNIKQYKRLEKQCIRTVKQAKIEVIKEFAEKLRKKVISLNVWEFGEIDIIDVEDIDELLKEYIDEK